MITIGASCWFFFGYRVFWDLGLWERSAEDECCCDAQCECEFMCMFIVECEAIQVSKLLGGSAIASDRTFNFLARSKAGVVVVVVTTSVVVVLS